MLKKALILILLMPLSAVAETAEQKGLRIAQESDRRDSGWQSVSSEMEMILRNARGEESLRSITVKTLEVDNDGDKSLTTFQGPKDVKGTSFLSYSHAIEPDEQWLFLPSLKRVKRISSANKSGPFMGSEFAFEDLSSFEIEKYTYKFLREEAVGDKSTYVLELAPQYKHSGYTKQIIWLDTVTYRPLKAEYYDRKNALLKTLRYSDYQQYLGKYWRADRMEMVNHQSGKSTVLNWKNYQFGVKLSKHDFTKNSLKRAR